MRSIRSAEDFTNIIGRDLIAKIDQAAQSPAFAIHHLAGAIRAKFDRQQEIIPLQSGMSALSGVENIFDLFNCFTHQENLSAASDAA